MADQNEEMGRILERLHSLELRLSRLESALNLDGNKAFDKSEEQLQKTNSNLNADTLKEEEKGLESQIGRFGLAWLGNIVLLFGITFLAQYLMNLGHRDLSFLFGYLAAAVIFIMANYINKSIVHLSFILRMNALVLLFYFTVRLHFFSASPIIPDKLISIVSLMFLVALQRISTICSSCSVFCNDCSYPGGCHKFDTSSCDNYRSRNGISVQQVQVGATPGSNNLSYLHLFLFMAVWKSTFGSFHTDDHRIS
jgi:hypothetical protein